MLVQGNVPHSASAPSIGQIERDTHNGVYSEISRPRAFIFDMYSFGFSKSASSISTKQFYDQEQTVLCRQRFQQQQELV